MPSAAANDSGSNQKALEEKIRALSALAKQAGLPDPAADLPEVAPVINLAWPIRKIAESCAKNIVGGPDPILFIRGRTPIVINEIDGNCVPLCPQSFRSFAEHYMAFIKPDSRGITMPSKVSTELAKAILASQDFLCRLPILRGINHVQLPVRRPADPAAPCGVCYSCRHGKSCEGKLEILPHGYDPQTGIYTIRHIADPALDYPKDWHLADCADFLQTHFRHFPWGETEGMLGTSFSIVLTMWLTLFGLSTLPPNTITPLFLLNANLEGSGKTRLAEVILYALHGDYEPFYWEKSDEEKQKHLDSLLFEGIDYVLIDNLKGNGEFRSVWLEQFATSPKHAARVFNTQTVKRVEKRMVAILTANNLKVHPETARRTLLADLFATETIKDRHLPPDAVEITQDLLADPNFRAKILACLWGLMRFANERGTNYPDTKLPSFESWSRRISKIAPLCNFADPLVQRVLPNAGDTTSEEVRLFTQAVVNELMARDGRSTLNIRTIELIPIARKHSLFAWILGTIEDSMIEMTKKKGSFQPVTDTTGGLERDPDESEKRHQAASWIKDTSTLTRFAKLLAARVIGQKATDKHGNQYTFGKRSETRHGTYTISRIDPPKP